MRKPRNKFRMVLVRSLAMLAIIYASMYFIEHRRLELQGAFTQLFERTVTKNSGFVVRIGKIEGDFFGLIRLENVTFEAPWLEGEARHVFSAKEIRLRYKLLDFISKSFSSKIKIILIKPVFNAGATLKGSQKNSATSLDVPYMSLMNQWVLAQKNNFILEAQDAKIILPNWPYELSRVDIQLTDSSLKANISLDHLKIHHMDVSTTVVLDAAFKLGRRLSEDKFVGSMHTEGSIINWAPLPFESSMDFEYKSGHLEILRGELLGGFKVSGSVDTAQSQSINLTVATENFPIANIAPLLNFSSKTSLPDRADAIFRIVGALKSPQIEGWIFLSDGKIGDRPIKALGLNLKGIYPTLQLLNSRLLLPDGTMMRFAERTVEFRDLFKGQTYSSLIAEAPQESFVFGDMQISREESAVGHQDLLMQKFFGKYASLNLRSSDEEVGLEKKPDKNATEQVKVGLEYRLKSDDPQRKDSLKVEMKEGEEFVGVERKMKF